MNAAARVTLAQLLREESIEEVPRDAQAPRRLLEQAGRHVQTATAGLTFDDHEGAFQIAYDSCRKSALALVLATGHRPRGDGQHATTFEAAVAVAGSVGASARNALTEASDLRYVRNGAEYRGEEVSRQDAVEAVEIAVEVHRVVAEPIEVLLGNA